MKELFFTYINDNLYEWLGVIITAFAGYIGIFIKSKYTEFINNETKVKAVKICVQAGNQLYRELHGEDKFNAVAADIVSFLSARNIQISEIEIKMLAESAVNALNKNIKNGG